MPDRPPDNRQKPNTQRLSFLAGMAALMAGRPGHSGTAPVGRSRYGRMRPTTGAFGHAGRRAEYTKRGTGLVSHGRVLPWEPRNGATVYDVDEKFLHSVMRQMLALRRKLLEAM